MYAGEKCQTKQLSFLVLHIIKIQKYFQPQNMSLFANMIFIYNPFKQNITNKQNQL